MRLNSSDLISRPTQNSTRVLLVFSGTVILVELTSLDPNKWQLLNGDVTSEVFSIAATVLLVFSSVSLLVHWRTDYYFYTKWFKSNEVSMGTLWGMSAPKSSEPPISGLRRRIGWLSDELAKFDKLLEDMKAISSEQVRRRDSEQKFPQKLHEVEKILRQSTDALVKVSGTLEGTELILDELSVRFRGVDFAARFVVFGWYLILPITSGLLAIALLWLHEPLHASP